jgi:hypothetical protein
MRQMLAEWVRGHGDTTYRLTRPVDDLGGKQVFGIIKHGAGLAIRPNSLVALFAELAMGDGRNGQIVERALELENDRKSEILAL